MDLRNTYDRIATDWHADHRNDTWWIGGTDAFAALAGAGATVLDVGCGGGTKSAYLIGKGLRVTGIDFSPRMITLAHREAPEAAFSVADIRTGVNMPSGPFDGIFLQAVLLHIPRNEASAIVARLAALLRPGGLFYIAVKRQKPGGPTEEIKQESDYGYPYERFFSYFTPEDIRGYLCAAGCDIVYENIAPTDGTRWIQIIGKT